MPVRAALIVAVETFFECGSPVPYAAADAAELVRLLPAVGYDPAKVVLVAATRTTKAAVESHLRRLPRLVGKADSLLVVVVARGFAVKGKSYLACADTLTTDPAETALAVADLLAALHKTKIADIAVLLDADPLALAGVGPGLDVDDLDKLFGASPACVGLLAAGDGERSFEAAPLRHGVWRHHLLEAFAGKVRAGVAKDGTLSAAALHAHLADAVPRTLRRTYDTPQEQTPLLLGEAHGGNAVADLAGLLGPNADLLDPARLKRVVFRGENPGRVKDLAGYRKTHNLPDRANEWARKYVARTAVADIKADLDQTFDMVREAFGYKRKDLDVSADGDGLGFIRTPDFEYTVSVGIDPDDLSAVVWRREVGRLSGPGLVRTPGFAAVFAGRLDQLVFEFASAVDVAGFVDRIEDAPPEGVKVGLASDAGSAEFTLAGFAGRVTVTAEAVRIAGRTGEAAGLLDLFLAFLGKFAGLGEAKALPPAAR